MERDYTVGIDLRVLAGGYYGGIPQYVLGLLPELFKVDRSIMFKLFFSGRKNKLPDYPWLREENVRFFGYNYPSRLLFGSSRLLNYPQLDNLVRGADVFFSPHFFVAPVSCRSVVTFHDLSFVRHPEFFSWRKNIWHRLEMNPREQARRADKIIAVSQSTKNDLINLFGLDEKKIEVVYSGVEHVGKSEIHPLENSRAKSRGSRVGGISDLPQDFFLFLGTLEPRKNVLGILKAFDYLHSGSQIPKDSALVIAGSPGWLYGDVLRFWRGSPYSRQVHFIGPVKEEDKSYLYGLAKVFVYPSFFEGFGFPPLEAMAAGVPVITSRVSSLPEVAGGAALLINPYNIKEIAEAMKNLFTDERLRDRHIQKGLERAKKFSWGKAAEETFKVLTSV